MTPRRSRARRIFRIAGYLLFFIIIILASVVVYIKTALPNVGDAPVLTVARTDEKIERGRYLANSICVCMDCHSTRDWTKYSGPLLDGTLGKGGERFDQNAGFPGIYYSRNITPAGITRYTDGELFRVITTGVNKEGRAMFPVMPYLHYGKMDTSDITSLIAYIRSLEPITNEVPESKSDFPLNIIINTIPQKGAPQNRPDTSDLPAYGKYLVNASACIECHTPVDQGKIIEKMAFSGGREFQAPDGSVIRSANITFDRQTGLGNWSADMFISKFKAYSDSSSRSIPVSPGEKNTVMPWTMYGRMTPSDLHAIYTYLKSLPAINKKVITFSAKS